MLITYQPLNEGRGSPRRWAKQTPEVGKADPTPHQRDPEQHLDMVRSQHDPPAEAVAQVDDGHAAAEADDVQEGHPQRDDENLAAKNPSGLTSILHGGRW